MRVQVDDAAAEQASTNLVKFVILLHQVLDGYVTLFQVYEHAISPDKLQARIAEGEERFRSSERLIVKKADVIHSAVVDPRVWQEGPTQDALSGRTTSWPRHGGASSTCDPLD